MSKGDLTSAADKRDADLDATYREEGWGLITDKAFGGRLRPKDVESQAREVARYAYTEISALMARTNEQANELAKHDKRRGTMRSPQDLRMQAREMETDARELESVISTIEFLNEHEGVVPRIDVEFPGFASDGAKAASQLESWITEQWPARREQLLEHFRARRDELKEKWA